MTVVPLDLRRSDTIFTAMQIRSGLVALSLTLFFCTTGADAADAAAPLTSEKSAAAESFQVRNKKFGDLLRPEDANSATGTRIVLYPGQPCKCMTRKFHPAGDAVFQLQNHFTSKTRTPDSQASGASQPVTQVPFAKERDDRPKWQFTKLADGTYRITDAKSGQALTAVKAADRAAANIVTEPWRETDEQKWERLKIDPAKLTM